MDTYEKKYKELVAKLKDAYNDESVNDDRFCCVMNDILPELAESEDERIMKALKHWLQTRKYDTIGGILISDILLWLEKQGKQKPADKAEAKFKVGDTVKAKTMNNFVFTIKAITNKQYVDTNDGKYDIEGQDYLELVEQKPAWSEEDEKHYQGCLNLMKLSLDTKPYPYYNDYLWLKSLKNRVQPQPKQEWSEEDEEMLTEFLHKVEVCSLLTNRENVWAVKRLKSLRPQNKWKPSDEQMHNLSEAAHCDCAFFNMEILKGLYDDLKKLRRE